MICVMVQGAMVVRTLQYLCVFLLQEDVFELKALDIGDVVSITIGHRSIGRGRGWYCACLQLRVDDNEKRLLFPCDR